MHIILYSSHKILFFGSQKKLSDMLLASDKTFLSLVSPTATDNIITVPTTARVRDSVHGCCTITMFVHFNVLGVNPIIVAICWTQ